MKIQKMILEYPDGYLEALNHIDHLRGMYRSDHGGRPIHIYLPQSASRLTYTEAQMAVHPLDGKVSYMKADFTGDLEAFKMDRLLGLI